MMTLPGSALLVAAAMAMPPAPQPMAMDTPVSLNGIETVCTGVGSGKDDPRWASYPIRIEFANAGAQNLSGAHLMISSGGKPVADINCLGPWVLVKGGSGSYQATATIAGSSAQPATGTFHIGNGGGQARIVLRFMDMPANQ